MDHPHYQQTHGSAEGNHQQPELMLIHLEQPLGTAPHHSPVHQHTINNGTAQLNSFGEHSRPEITSNLQGCLSELPPIPPDSRKRKWTREKDWEDAKTSVLVECVNLLQFRDKKRNQYCTKWEAMADEIWTRENRLDFDSAITAKRCKERMKTLRGYFKKSMKEKKAGVTEDECRKSNGIVVDWWYDAIAKFRGPREGKSISTQNEGDQTRTQNEGELTST